MQKIFLTIVLWIIGSYLYAQSLEVSGRIRDRKDQPLPGVNVIIKGTPIAAVTDPDGYFKITVPYGSHILIYSFIGYKSLEQKIYVTMDFPWELEVAMATKGSKEKGSAKFVERAAISDK